MSKLQAQSINRGKLQRRAQAHAKRLGDTVPGMRAESWMCGYIACLDDVRKVVNGGGTPPDVAENIAQWAEEQP